MKTKFKTVLLLPFFALLIVTSCQEEAAEITPPDDAQTLVAESTLTALVGATSKKDGSKDNILDNASCLSVELPVTVKINGLEIIIDSEEDFETIERIYDEFEDDVDRLDFIFPITIVTPEHNEIVIHNAGSLGELVEECKGENEQDEDIECIDFSYPISFSIFDANLDNIDTVTIENDKALHLFIKSVKNEEVIASLNFPVTMLLADGTQVKVNNNEELQSAIEEAKDTCDEDDDNDHNDDDFTKERLDNYLKECPWVVFEFKRDNQDNTEEYGQYALNFKEDAVVTMRARNGDVLTGTWSTRVSNRGALLKMTFESLADFTLEWLVYDLEPGKIKLYETGGNRIILKRNCDVIIDDLKERLENYLQECDWIIHTNKSQGEYVYRLFNYRLEFLPDGLLVLNNGKDEFEGTWELKYNENQELVMSIVITGEDTLNFEWPVKVQGVTEKRLEFYLEGANYKLILQRLCDNGDTDADISGLRNVLKENVWVVTSYIDGEEDKTNFFEAYSIDLQLNNQASILEGGEDFGVGLWRVLRDSNYNLNVYLNFTGYSPFEILTNDWKFVSASTMGDRVELKHFNDDETYSRLVLELEQ